MACCIFAAFIFSQIYFAIAMLKYWIFGAPDPRTRAILSPLGQGQFDDQRPV